MSPSLDEIAAFVAVIDHGSFSAAAEKLGLSVSVTSKRLKSLEERLSAQLIQRTTRRLSLTQAGELLYDQVKHIPGTVVEAEERVRELQGEVKGRLRVIMPTYFESEILSAEVVPRYLQAFPGVTLRLTIVDDPLEHLRDEFDLLVTGKLPHQRFPDATVINRRILKLRGRLFASPRYLEEHGAPGHPNELSSHNCLSYLNREWHFTEPSGRELIVHAEGTLTTNSNDLLRTATMAGLGITYAFPIHFRVDVEEGRVVQLLDEFTEGSYVAIHVLYPNTPFVPQRTRAFIEALSEHFSG